MLYFNIFLFLIIFQLLQANDNEEKLDNNRYKRGIVSTINSTFSLPILYFIKFNITTEPLKLALTHISKKTCIKFREAKKPFKKVGLHIQWGTYNNIIYGNKYGNRTLVNLDKYCINDIGCIKHILGLALGLIPHHNRWDRDQYVKIHYNAINKIMINKFKKVNWDETKIFNTPFDYGSISNYDVYYYSKKYHRTYSPIQESLYMPMLGQRDDFTHNDIKLLNDLYCGNVCSTKIKGCKNGGYPDPKNCSQCRCPPGFTSTLCDKVEDSTGVCDKKILFATKKEKTLQLRTSGRCTHLIISPAKTRVQILIDDSVTKYDKICTTKGSLEIRYRHNKGLTGLCLCRTVKNHTLEAVSGQVLIRYMGTKSHKYYSILKYKAIQ
uniref:Metalloendopeptidase n=1 Tax=Strongyloides stercoralis TaxID=6248 RepID=A0A0K0EH05_STRER